MLHTSEELRRSTERLQQLGAEQGDPVARAMPEALMGANLVFAGQPRAGASLLEKAIPVIESANDPVGAAILYEMLTLAYARLGDFAAAERNAERQERLAEQGDPIARLDATIARAIVASERGDLEDAARLATQCATLSEELGATGCALPANYFLGDARLRLNEAATARPPFERTLQLAAAEAMGSSLGWLGMLAEAGLAAAAAQLGDPDQATREWETILEAARGVGDPFLEAAVLTRRALASVRAEAPDLDAALADLEAAIRIYEEIETRPALARALRGYSQVLARAGHDRDARAARSRSDALAAELGLRDREVVA
jgi:tetratricopeptide (TPR) repeat protein